MNSLERLKTCAIVTTLVITQPTASPMEVKIKGWLVSILVRTTSSSRASLLLFDKALLHLVPRPQEALTASQLSARISSTPLLT